MNRWKEHFQAVLNRQFPKKRQYLSEIEEELHINCGKIPKNEIKKAVKKVKNGKASGGDTIPPEILKADRGTTADILYDLFNAIWEREVIPDEWKKRLLIKLPKRDNLSHCGNCRGIMLLSVPCKIQTRIILERLKSAQDAKLREEQDGYRTGRSCTDQIATLRIIVEQSIEWQSTLYLNFNL